MTWLKKDDRFPEHRKIRRLCDGAYRLHDTALHACAKDETDGLVTEHDIEDMEHGPRLRKYVDVLVKAGLWEVVEDGWMIHDYLHYNPSHEQLNAKREADRERQAARRQRITARSDHDTPGSVSDSDPRKKETTPGSKHDRSANPDETPSGDDVSRRDSAVSHAPVTEVSQHPVPSRPVPSRTTPNGVVSEPRKRGQRLPAEFVPSQASRDTIRASFPTLDLAHEHAKFCDYWQAISGQKAVRLDWDATWRNWMRRAGEEAVRLNGRRTRQQETDDLFARAAVRMGVIPADHLAIEGATA